MIDPAGIPVIDGNMDALAAHARTISTTGQAFADTGADVHNTWQGLYPHYIAPESGQLLSATGIVATTAASVGEDLGTAGTALTTYADEVRNIQAALVDLKSQAEGLAAERTAAGEDWASDSALVERDTALIDAVNAQMAAFADAERRCANALRVLYGAPLLTADNGDGVIDPATEHGFTAEQLDAAARNGGTPWGATSEVDHPWPIDVLQNVGSFFGGLYQSGEGAVVGIGTLLGAGGGEAAGAAWGALGTLATGALVYGLVGVEEAERLDHNGSIPWLAPGAMGQSLEDAGKAFIAYDQWDDDPARAAGATLGNVILTVVGPKAVGGATRGAGAALGRIPGPVAARTSQALINAGTTIGRTPTLTDISRYARNTFPGFRSPDIRTPPILPSPDAPPRGPSATGANPVGADGSGRVPDSPNDTSTVNASPDHRPDPRGSSAIPAAPGAVADPPPARTSETSESGTSGDRAPEREPALVGAGAASAADSITPDMARIGDSGDVPDVASSPPDLSTRTPPVVDSADMPGPSSNMDGLPTSPGTSSPSVDRAAHDAPPEGSTSRGTAGGQGLPPDSVRPAASGDVPLDGPTSRGPMPYHEGDSASTDGSHPRQVPESTPGSPLVDMPDVGPGQRSLEVIDDNRLVRDDGGLITEVDGVPVRQYLAAVALDRAEQFRAGRDARTFSGVKVGQVTSAAIDTRTGQIIEATNGRAVDVIPPERVHPLLAERVAQAEAEPGHPNINRDGSVDSGTRPYPAPYDPLNHAEVKAVNELLWRRGADATPSALSEIRVDNYFPFGEHGVRTAPCCASCAVILDGVRSNAGRFTGFPPGPHNRAPEE